MKITKTQLKQIIKEELASVLREDSPVIAGTEIKPYQFPKGKTSFEDEEDVLPIIQQAVGDMEISEPGLPSWDERKDQIVYLGRQGNQAYFKTSPEASENSQYYTLEISQGQRSL